MSLILLMFFLYRSSDASFLIHFSSHLSPFSHPFLLSDNVSDFETTVAGFTVIHVTKPVTIRI